MRYKFSMVYRPGAEAAVPDALSRREQDTLGRDDYNSRYRQLIPKDSLQKWPRTAHLTTEGDDGSSSYNALDNKPDILPTAPETTFQGPDHEPAAPEGPFQDPNLNTL
jgi:hypothetical protein